MHSKVVLAFIAVVACVYAAVNAETKLTYLSNPKLRSMNDYVYFTDTDLTLRSREEAKRFCISEDAELAKITDMEIYNFLRLTLPKVGRYWVDGRDVNNIERFSLDDLCTNGTVLETAKGQLNAKLDGDGASGGTCLTIVKGYNATSSKIQALSCATKLYSVCAFPKVGCFPTTPPTKPTTTRRAGS